MPADEPFYDELLAAGVRAACQAGAKLQALDLLYFAGAGRLACVRELLAAGAPVKRITCGQLVDCGVGGTSYRASYRACYSEEEEEEDFDSWSPAWQACAREMAASGLRLRASKGEDPLIEQAAVRSGGGHLEFLVSIGADVDERDERGGTALMSASRMGDSELVGRLLALGADPWARDKNGRDARASAAHNDQTHPPRQGEVSAVAEFDRAMAKWELAQIGSSARAAPAGPRAPRL